MTRPEEQFDPLLTRKPKGEPKISYQRQNDIEKHIAQISLEMPGCTLAALEIVKHIVLIRRQQDVQHHYQQMLSLLEKYAPVMLRDFTSRWLVSICDTIADLGTPQQSANAMIVVTWINTIKMCQTMWHRLENQTYQKDNIPNAELWDGITTYNIAHGDTWHNLNKRNRRVLGQTPLLLSIYTVLQERLINSNTSFNQLAKLRGNFYG